ncbi:hypothetical protein LTR95_005000 [Oleoguttula sp. CCFEE 5521]
MNWTDALEPLYGSDGDAIASLAWDATYCTGMASLGVESFEENYHESGVVDVSAVLPEALEGLVDKPLSGRLAKQLQSLLNLPTWLVLMDTVVVHLSHKAAAEKGLFELLGDDTVQVVDVAEQEVLHKYYDAAGLLESLSSGGDSSGGHRFDSIAQIGEDLEYVLMKAYGCRELLRHMRPAVMFRLCTRKCQTVL